MQACVKSEAVLKRISSTRLFGVVAQDAPDYDIRPGPEGCSLWCSSSSLLFDAAASRAFQAPIRTVSGIRSVAAGFRHASFAVLRPLPKRLPEIKIHLW
jgi:hypothetical protein